MCRFAKSLILSLILFGASHALASTDYQKLENLDGKAIEAQLLRFENEEVRIRKRDGQVFTLKIDQFSETTRNHIRAHFKPAPSEESGKEKLSPNVVLLESLIAALKVSAYKHEIDVRESEGIAYADCSGLTRYILEETLPEHISELREEQGGSLAKNYYHFFTGLDEEGTRNWQRIDHFEEVQPGDIIAWASNGLTERGTTGHVMTAMSQPKRESRNKYRLEIADAARSPHFEDTRENLESKEGVGKGTMWFGTDDDGKPIMWWWKNPEYKSSPEDPASILGVAVGRPR